MRGGSALGPSRKNESVTVEETGSGLLHVLLCMSYAC